MLPLIAGIEGTRLSAREAELFSRLQPAGYILFSRNIEDYEETRELTDALRRLTTGAYEPIIALDQEGGRVIRTAAIGIRLPSAAALGAAANAHWVEQAALYSSRCLHTLGVNTVLAPVLDYGSERANALGGRCWGADSQAVISYAGVWNRIMQRRGILTCGKHFPGMGEARQDPHFSLPQLEASREQMLAENGSAIPFTALMDELPSIMVAHPVAVEVDAERPASLSPAVVGMRGWCLRMISAWAQSRRLALCRRRRLWRFRRGATRRWCATAFWICWGRWRSLSLLCRRMRCGPRRNGLRDFAC